MTTLVTENMFKLNLKYVPVAQWRDMGQYREILYTCSSHALGVSGHDNLTVWTSFGVHHTHFSPHWQ